MRGFIIDAPNALIVSGNKASHVVTASSGQVQLQGSMIDINGGQGLYSLTSIPSQTQLNITLTDAMFNSDSFVISTGAVETKNVVVKDKKFGTPFVIDATTFEFTIPEAIVPQSLHIAGLTEDTTPAALPTATTYVVTYNVADTVVKFDATLGGEQVLPSYDVAVAGGTTYDMMIDSIPSKGEVTIKFPIYSNDSVNSSIEAYGQFHFYSAMINLNNTFGGNYKTASTFEMQIKGMNSNRPDKKIFSFDIIPA